MPHIASMGIYVVKASVMRELLLDAYATANDFGSEIIPGAVAMGKRVQAYLFEGYWEDIGTIGAFYSSQLALLQDDAQFSFYDMKAPVFSMSRFLPPSRINVRDPQLQRARIRPMLDPICTGAERAQAAVTHARVTVHPRGACRAARSARP